MTIVHKQIFKYSVAVTLLYCLVPTNSALAACTSPTGVAGEMIYNSSHKVVQYCDDTNWVALGGGGGGGGEGGGSGGGASMTADMIVAFESATCPEGWEEYVPARGRFLRGIDSSGATNVDPDGKRTPGSIQQSTRLPNGSDTYHGDLGTLNKDVSYRDNLNSRHARAGSAYNGPQGSYAIRPINVAVLFCKYTGSGGGRSGGGFGDNLGNHTATENIKLSGRYLSGDGGDEGVFVANNGNVGIGNTTPVSKLHVGNKSGMSAISVEGSHSSMSALALHTHGTGSAITGTSGARSWLFEAKGSGWSNAASREDFFLTFWDGAAYRERLFIDSATGNVGIDFPNAFDKLTVNGPATVFTTINDHGLRIAADSTNAMAKLQFSNKEVNSEWGYITSYPNGSMRINATAGNVSIGAAPALDAALYIYNTGNAHTSYMQGYAGGYYGAVYKPKSNPATAAAFLNANGDVIGSISTTASTTAYNTTSDYRLKTNVLPIEGALETVMRLKPSNYVFKNDPEKKIDGFIAHEVQEIAPYAVTGKKDAVDENGKPIYQQVDYGKLTPLLVAAIKELKSDMDMLKAENQALKDEIKAIKTSN